MTLDPQAVGASQRVFPFPSRSERGLPARLQLAFLWLVISLLHVGASSAADGFPAASNVVKRLVERAQFVADAGKTNRYTYEKRSVMAELDEQERVTKSTEKLYRVVMVGGLTFPRLVKLQGRELTGKELEKENQREAAFRQKFTRVDVKQKAKKREGMATQELVDRFEFKVARREMMEGRSTLALEFTPRPGASGKTIEDKVFQHVSGTLWVDEQDAEVAKLDARVQGPIPLGWFGAVGALNKFQAIIERSRLADGVWVNRKSAFSIIGRKLFSAMRIRTTEESSGFRRE